MKKILTLLVCSMILFTACGKKEPEIITEVKLYEPCKTFDNVEEWKTSKERIVDVIDGNFKINEIEIKIPSKIGELKNKDTFMELYEAAFEEYDDEKGIGFYCDDYNLPIEERTIEGIDVFKSESYGEELSEIKRGNGGFLEYNSMEEMVENCGKPDIIEESEGFDYDRNFAAIYYGKNYRVDYFFTFYYDESEEPYSYNTLKKQELKIIGIRAQGTSK